MGPTACGKTAAACRLADEFDAEIVSVDSALVYRGLDIGTAKPSPMVLARYPHHLIDLRDPGERYSAAQFRSDALAAIDDVHRRGRMALLVGGTGLYFRVLREGIADLPDGDPRVRERLARELAAHGLPLLYARLAEVDPVSAKRIHPHDPQRTLRALEVYETAGTPMSELLTRTAAPGLPQPPLQLVLAPADRAWLHHRIAVRFDAMLRAGFVNEVRALRARGDLSPEDPALRAVGYRAVWQYLDGELTFEMMRERGTVATRQLAKRQFTWFRGVSGAHWVDPRDAGSLSRLRVEIKRHIEVN
jgi:tRNA dimethylallyltransferase